MVAPRIKQTCHPYYTGAGCRAAVPPTDAPNPGGSDLAACLTIQSKKHATAVLAAMSSMHKGTLARTEEGWLCRNLLSRYSVLRRLSLSCVPCYPETERGAQFSLTRLWFCGVPVQVPVMLCDKPFSWGDTIHTSTHPDRDHKTDQRTHRPLKPS